MGFGPVSGAGGWKGALGLCVAHLAHDREQVRALPISFDRDRERQFQCRGEAGDLVGDAGGLRRATWVAGRPENVEEAQDSTDLAAMDLGATA